MPFFTTPLRKNGSVRNFLYLETFWRTQFLQIWDSFHGGASLSDDIFFSVADGQNANPELITLIQCVCLPTCRFLFMAKSIGLFFNISKADTNYSAMPLYHSAAGILGVGHVIINGTSMALRKKFSASNFWHDCIKYNATVRHKNASLWIQPCRPEIR